MQAALLAFCDANAGAAMCQSSGACTDTYVRRWGRVETCWREGSDPCSGWKGVYCDDDVTVTQL